MKHLFILILALFCYFSHANDTLTVAEVYSFNVGDTFDYKITDQSTFWNNAFKYDNYIRLVVTDMDYSARMDTLIITYSNPNGNLSYDTITNLLQKAIFSIDSMFPNTNNCQYYYYLQNSPFSSRPINGVQESCFEQGTEHKYAYGLGKIGFSEGHRDGNDYTQHSYELIYFSNADTSIGTPYNIANGSHLVQFVPLPEEYATWTKVITTPGSGSGFEAIIEQIRTGSKTESNGRAYIELIYRCINNLTNTFTPDTVLGYFYNDTLNKTVMFSVNIGEDGNMLYSFTELNGNSCGGGGWVNISTVSIGGQSRTMWNCVAGNGLSTPHLPKIAGIGSLSGLLTVKTYTLGPHTVYGSLSCFSVCGEVLYPVNSNGKYCDLLTSIDEEFEENVQSLYPNPANSQIAFTQSNTKYMSYIVMDLNGSTILSGSIEGSTAIIPVENLASGMYFFRAYNKNGNSVSRKLMVE